MRKTVLIVDDDDVVMGVVSTVVKALGFTIVTASNGAEGLAMFKKHSHEIILIITDYEMPILNGRQMLDEIKRLNPSINSIMVTGICSIESAKFPEPSVVLTKPIKFESLISACEEYRLAA